jgi:6-pyruvoyltetrahydropterin/6-carboxytetrahydropterin synthase
MPVADVAPLPIDNSTAERLAGWFAGRVTTELAGRGITNIHRVSVGIEEAPGQAGWCTIDVPGPDS